MLCFFFLDLIIEYTDGLTNRFYKNLQNSWLNVYKRLHMQ